MLLSGAVDLNTKLRKILNAGNLTSRLLSWDLTNSTLMGKNVKLRSIKWEFQCSCQMSNNAVVLV
jgi:hypothetical protein